VPIIDVAASEMRVKIVSFRELKKAQIPVKRALYHALLAFLFKGVLISIPSWHHLVFLNITTWYIRHGLSRDQKVITF
jgi:hypothetical protein